VPIERKQEQKLWDAFRKPIDDAFQRKTADREKAAGALGEFDRMVVEASKAVAEATASGDAQKIHAAAKALEAVVRGQVPVAAPVVAVAPAVVAASAEAVVSADAAESVTSAAEETPATAEADASTEVAETDAAVQSEAAEETAAEESSPEVEAEAAAPVVVKAAPKPVVAMRGDDRPGMRKAEPAPAGRGGKFGDRKDPRAGGKDARPRTGMENKFEPLRDERGGRGDRFSERPAFEERGPRLGDAAFRAQREAFETANSALKKLAEQAHGEVLTHLMSAWERRDPEQLPTGQDLGKKVPAAVRTRWAQALTAPAAGDSAEALLRMEIATELPTPAEHISARRLLQLQLLTRRNAPAPHETWAEDMAKVFASPYDAAQTRRVQNVLKALLKR
jgi:ATP-dependent RNA helicase SUPV3L1/SUV3